MPCIFMKNVALILYLEIKCLNGAFESDQMTLKFTPFSFASFFIVTFLFSFLAENLPAAEKDLPFESFAKIKNFQIKPQGSTPYDCGYQDGSALSARFCNPVGIASNGTHLYIVDSYNHVIRKLALASGSVTTLAGTSGSFGSVDKPGTGARFLAPRGATLDHKGVNLFLTDTGNHSIRRIVLATGEVSTLAGNPEHFGLTDGEGFSSRFNEPEGITIDPTDTFLYVVDSLNHAIRKIQISNGKVTTLAGRSGFLGFEDGEGEKARFDHPAGIAIDHIGRALYVTDASNQAVRKIMTATGEVSTIAGPSSRFGKKSEKGDLLKLFLPKGLTLDPTDSFLFVADSANHAIFQINLHSEEVLTFSGTIDSSPLFGFPQGICYDPLSQGLYFSDKKTNSIRKWVPSSKNLSTVAGPPFPYPAIP